jgi:cephalosporin-C deacetylase-like acetyl esterase
MDSIAQKQLDQREATIAKIGDTAQAAQRQAYVRNKILELIGGLPEYTGPLNARVTGQIEQPGFVIEKVIFESLPRLYVTANLYRPNRAGKFPGVLLPLGHWDYGKPAVQQIAGNLAMKGFVVLTYDPLGQGERLQIYDKRYEGSLAGGSTEQHLLAGGQSALVGQSFARYRIWDAKRALDYLVSRPEVMPDRIGCTGCSGGGTITTYISALDSRIKVAAPACYINSFRLLFSGPTGDSEQTFANFISSGLDLADYIELFAPKPWLISSTSEDFFPLEGARMAYTETSKWYALFNAKDKLKWAIGPGGHGTPLLIREAIYEWMIRWLKDGDGSAAEQDVPRLPEHALFATNTGQVADVSGSRDVSDLLSDDLKNRRKAGTRAELIETLRKLVDPPQHAPTVAATGADISFETEPGIEVGGTLLAPKPSGGGSVTRKPAVLIVETRRQLPSRAIELANQGNTVLVIVPRGLPATDDGRRFSGDWLPNVRAWLIGRNLPAMRAHDILNAFQLLAARDDVDPAQIRAEASGIAGIWLLIAAALEPRMASIAVDRTPYSFQAAFDNPLTRDLHGAIVPGFALHWDLADLITDGRTTWTDPVDWLGHVVALGDKYKYSPKGE